MNRDSVENICLSPLNGFRDGAIVKLPGNFGQRGRLQRRAVYFRGEGGIIEGKNSHSEQVDIVSNPTERDAT